MKSTAKAMCRIHADWSEEVPFRQGMSLGKSVPIFTSTPQTGLPAMSRIRLLKTYTGDIEADGEVVYLTIYGAENSARYVGLERLIGQLAGKPGSFVLQRTGVYEGGEAKEFYTVVPGSGTGELTGLTGEGSGTFGHGTEIPFTLHYELP